MALAWPVLCLWGMKSEIVKCIRRSVPKKFVFETSMDTSVYEYRIRELLPFVSKQTVREAIQNLRLQIEEEIIMKSIETQLSVNILKIAKEMGEVTRMAYVRRFLHEYLLFENFTISPLFPDHYELKGYGDNLYLYTFEIEETTTHNIFVSLKRLGLKTKSVSRVEKEVTHKMKNFPTFEVENVRSDEKLIHEELVNIRSAFLPTWKNLNLSKTPANSEKSGSSK